MEYVNIMEAARRCNVSDKTIRRAIHKGALAAQFPKKNQCIIAVSDLEAWHELSMDVMERRTAVLEESWAKTRATVENLTTIVEGEKYNTVRYLHALMEDLKAQNEHIVALEQRLATLEAKSTQRPTKGKVQKRRDLVSLDRFIASHGLTPLDFQRAVNVGALQPPDEMEQKQEDGSVVIVQALDSEGRRAFYEALHESVPTWMDCPICPHSLV